ncbi:MAG TPA: 5-(carboxyamino)imidazole ribonucleotide synthase [Verrucomicrobiales bacterium]|nr:5-(carboxyamino)imidazole ribonucleotide synthase [Verrucomicrobiales bacterium]
MNPSPTTVTTTARQLSGGGPRIGIVGGGQLARMTALAAFELGCDVVVLERAEQVPAANLAVHTLIGDWDNPAALVELAKQVDIVTLENEFVDARSLAAIEAVGRPLHPTSRTIGIVQDKLTQKQALAEAGLEVPRFRAVASPEEIAAAAKELGWPLVLKARRNGYDGKGNATLRDEAGIAGGWQKLGAGSRELFVEEWCPFTRELAAIVTRSINGDSAVYPVVETVQRDHICHRVIAPAPVAADVVSRASELAQAAVAAVGGTGSFGVEMFLTADGKLVVNELAPRVHNSGHYTIEGCHCSQFENHLRAILGWPLGSTELVMPAAVMVNLLGAAAGPGRPTGVEKALAIPGAHVHVYGKTRSNAGRKMGHVTALGRTVAEAIDRAGRAAREIRFGN